MILAARPLTLTVSRLFLAKTLCVVLTLSGGCKKETGLETLVYTGNTMGTTYSVKAVFPDAIAPIQAKSLGKDIQNKLDKLDAIFSTYKENSELSRINREPAGRIINIKSDMYRVLALAEEIYGLSAGYFDPTVGPLVDLWGFGPAKVTQAPSPEAVSQTLEGIGFDALTVKKKSLKKRRPVRLDLSAIAKGDAVDQIAIFLEQAEASGYMVEIGGEIRTNGTRDDLDMWQIAVEAPVPGQHKVQRILKLGSAAVATSGDYRNYREVNGKVISHSIDPQTGFPVDHRLASVTVVHNNCAAADAWATAFMVAGPDKGFELAEEYYFPALFIVKTDSGFEERPTAKMKERFPDLFGDS